MSSSIDRRGFLGAATAAGAAGLTSRAFAINAVGANDKIVVGVMGLSRGRSLAVGFAKMPNVEVKYVCDVDSRRVEAGEKLIAGLGGKPAKGTTQLQEILDDKSVDVLVCAAPNHWHAPATIMALNHDKHVYVEKPCSHNPQEGEWMVEAARKRNRAVQMGAQRRSGATYQEAVERLRNGDLGRVYAARCWYYAARTATGTSQKADVPSTLNYELWQGPAPRRDYATNRVPYKWHWFWHWGNGELGNNGVHTLDICRWGLGVDYPIRVSSSGGRYHFQDDQETPDTHTVGFDFADRKSIVWQGHSCNRHGGGFVTFYAEKGSMEVDDRGYRIYDNEKGKLVEEKTAKSRGDSEHIANLVDAIRNDTPLKLNAEILEGHRSTLLCHLGNIAHRTGRTLNCDPSNGHVKDDQEAMKLWQREYEQGWEPKV